METSTRKLAGDLLGEEAAEDAQLFHCGPLEPREARPGSRPLRDEGLFMEATVARAICSVVALFAAPRFGPAAIAMATLKRKRSRSPRQPPRAPTGALAPGSSGSTVQLALNVGGA